MTDTDLLGNARNTRDSTGTGWAFSLCTADEGESDSEPEDASTGSHTSSTSPQDPPVSEELRLVRDLDLGARQDTAIFKSNPWTIAKLGAATRKPPPITPSTGHLALSIPPDASTNVTTRTAKARSILDPHPKKHVRPQPTPGGKKSPSQKQKQKLSAPQTKRKPNSVANSRAIGVSTCSDSQAIYKPGKTADAVLAQPKHPRPSNRSAATSCEQEEKIQPSTLKMHSTGPPFPLNVSVSPVAVLGHTSPSLSPVKHSPLHTTTRTRVSPNRFGSPHRLPDSLFVSSYEPPTVSPVKLRSPALSANRTGTKRKHSPEPLRPERSPANRAPNLLPTARSPAEQIAPPKTLVHQQRASAYDSRVFTPGDEEWSNLPQKKLRILASKDQPPMTQNLFRIPGLKLPRIGDQTPKKSWLLTTFQPPPLLKVPSPSISQAAENLEDDDGQIPPSESINNSSSQTVVENEDVNDKQIYLGCHLLHGLELQQP